MPLCRRYSSPCRSFIWLPGARTGCSPSCSNSPVVEGLRSEHCFDWRSTPYAILLSPRCRTGVMDAAGRPISLRHQLDGHAKAVGREGGEADTDGGVGGGTTAG
jgi:hypothetical protein